MVKHLSLSIGRAEMQFVIANVNAIDPSAISTVQWLMQFLCYG